MRFYQCQVLVNYFSDRNICYYVCADWHGAVTGVRINKMSAPKARNLFYAYAAVGYFAFNNIASLHRLICCRILITAGAFAGLSIYGYTTKRNLSALGFPNDWCCWIVIGIDCQYFHRLNSNGIFDFNRWCVLFAGLTA